MTPSRCGAGIGDFVADIPFAAGHPSRPALDRIADGLAALDVPALLLWGPRDPVFLEEHLRDLQQRLPQAVLHRYEKASHLLPEDAPGYPAAIARWITQLPPDPTTDKSAAASTEPVAPAGRHRRAAVQVPPPPSVLAELTARAGDDGAAVVEVGGHRVDGGRVEQGRVEQGRVEQRSISWAELAGRVRDTAAGLAAAGVRPGDRVALLVPPSIELTVALYAVWQAGGVIVVVDKGLGLRGMGRALRSARIDHLIADTPGLLAAGPMRVPGNRIATREVSAIVAPDRPGGAHHARPWHRPAETCRVPPNPVPTTRPRWSSPPARPARRRVCCTGTGRSGRSCG